MPQFTGGPVHLPPFRPSHGPTGLYNVCKGSEADGPHRGSQTPPISGQLTDQGPVSREAQVNPQTVVDLTQSLGRIINQEKSELKPTVFIHELRLPPRFTPCKTHSREMAQSSRFEPTQTCFDCKMFDIANWVTRLNREDGPGVSSQGALEISSVVGQPPSLVRDHFRSPRVGAKSCKRDEGCRPSPQRP